MPNNNDHLSPWLLWVPLVVGIGGLGLLAYRDADLTVPAEPPTALGGSAPHLLPDHPREPIPLERVGPIGMRVYMSPFCGCCSVWIEHLEENGFAVETVLRHDMGEVKAALGIAPQDASCHTGVVHGYLVEGHVPAADIRAFLAEAPDARGLAVPGMPMGAPGMEMGDRVDPHDVLILQNEGSSRVLRSYGR